MNEKNRIHLWIFIILNVIVYFLYFYFYNRLPERMASHFGFSSAPDGWTTRGSFVVTFIIIQTITSLLFIGIYFLIPRIEPNLPNKEYYLAEPRREQTLSIIKNSLLDIGSYTTLLLIITSYFVIDFNISGDSFLSPLMTYLVILYLIIVMLTSSKLYFKFRKIR